jgi:long-chain acyl-CoA synthetase
MKETTSLTLSALLADSSARFTDRPALSFAGGTPITYKQLNELAGRLASALSRRGIGPGDRVAILSENMPHWGVAYLAVTGMGAVAVPILPDFHSREIANILDHASCRAVFVSRKLREKLEPDLRSVHTVVVIDSFSLLLEGGGEESFPAGECTAFGTQAAPDDLAAIIYTSGTTGRSKGVMLTHANIVSNARAASGLVMVGPQDRLLSLLPLAHTLECTLGLVVPLLAGGSVAYLDRPPTANVMLPALKEVKPTMILSVPLIIEKIVRKSVLARFDRPGLMGRLYRLPPLRRLLHRLAGKKLAAVFGGRLRFFGIGGAPLAPEVERFLREAKFPYAIGYGLTETSPLIAGCSPALTRYRSTGPVLPGVELRIDNPDPISGEGEISVRGENVMRGYYRNAEGTAEVLGAEGWFRTGDLGLLDKDGYLYIKGRLKNMILGPSGENIYPEEIEALLNSFAFVQESLVFQQQGQLVARVHLNYEELKSRFKDLQDSAAQLQRHGKALIQELRGRVNRKLNAFSRLSRIIEQLEPFEKTPTKKIKRYLYLPQVVKEG